MTSKIVVNNIEADAGINTVTIIGDVSVGSSITATDITATHHGSGADLTNLPAANLTGTLPAISGANLTGINTAFGSGTSVNTSGIITATAFVPTTQGSLSHRNLFINGACIVAQRGTSLTGEGYLVDRIEGEHTSLDENPTYAQVDVASGTTPYTEGFRKALKITNGNQTSGANADDRYQIFLKLEGQDVANSGWNYTSSSSYITLQFWVKSSVSQNFYGYFRTIDGTGQKYVFETGTLSANTWTKITKTIPGNSNITIDNDNGHAFQLNLSQYFGTNMTDSGVGLNSWAAYAGATRTPTQTTTWYTTNDATLEYTGFQLEVGPVATPFEHRSYNEELQRCKRYYQQYPEGPHADNYIPIPSACCACNSGTLAYYTPSLFPGMRSSPSFSTNGNFRVNGTSGLNNVAVTAIGVYHNGSQSIFQYITIASGFTAGHAVILSVNNDASAYIAYNAEL